MMDAATITVVLTVVGLAIAQAGVVVTVMITLHGQTMDAITALSGWMDTLATRVGRLYERIPSQLVEV